MIFDDQKDEDDNYQGEIRKASKTSEQETNGQQSPNDRISSSSTNELK